MAVPKYRNRLGITPFECKPTDLEQYEGNPERPYPGQRITTPDLCDLFEHDLKLLWRECVPGIVPLKFRHLRATAHDELWENHPDNGVGGSVKEAGFGETGIAMKLRTPKLIKKHPQEWTEDELLGLEEDEKQTMRDFYPTKKFR